MSDNQRSTSRHDTSIGSGKTYAAPKLKEFGQVGQLTQSGTGVNSENTNPGIGPKSKRP